MSYLGGLGGLWLSEPWRIPAVNQTELSDQTPEEVLYHTPTTSSETVCYEGWSGQADDNRRSYGDGTWINLSKQKILRLKYY